MCVTRPDLNKLTLVEHEIFLHEFYPFIRFYLVELAPIKEVIYEIRFMSMSAKEFAETVAHSDLLTANEKLGFLSNIVSDKSAVPVPPGFTMKRNRLMMNQER